MYNKPYHYNKKLLFLKYWVWKTRGTFFVALDILKINTNSDLKGVGCLGGGKEWVWGGVRVSAVCCCYTNCRKPQALTSFILLIRTRGLKVGSVSES